ncbi:MAG: sigma-70 family RNA polymerase sigma factor [Thermoguttaceae bacterium]|jgi:RNA polymerase sigma-70 factor (ECF subfamily)|nr:sigma-70 family RNA polymerase sigma factor [Thermoguttaceae bacterium]
MNPSQLPRQSSCSDTPRPEDSLEGTFTRHQSELLGMLYYLTGNAEDARDAFQEAFVKCWRRREGLGEIEDLRAWVFRVALNVGRDMRATAWRRRRRPLPEDDMAAAPQVPPHEDLDRRERLAMIQRALRDLRAEEQEVFLLRQNAQMTYEEIATSIDIPVGTAKTRMRLALEKLRMALEQTAAGRRTTSDER